MKPTLSPRKRVLPVTPWTARSYWSLQGLPLLVLSLSLCLFGVGEGMLLVSNLGASPWVVLAQGVSLRSGVGIGTVTFLISVAVITFPPDFAQRLAQGQAALVQVVLDARNSSTAAAAGVVQPQPGLRLASAAGADRLAQHDPDHAAGRPWRGARARAGHV